MTEVTPRSDSKEIHRRGLSKRSADLRCVRSAAFRARQRSSARFAIASARHRVYIARMSRLRRPLLYERDIFVTVDLLTEHAGVDAAEQEKPCGLTIDRVSRRRGTSG